MKIILLSLAAILLLACNKEDLTSLPKPDPSVNIKKIGDESARFGWEVFRQMLISSTDHRILISPWSITSAMSMALNGADGTTEQEMRNILFHNAVSTTPEANRLMYNLMLTLGQNKGVRLDQANGAFYDPDRMALNRSFLDTLDTYFQAGDKALDFDDPASLSAINGWVREKTQQKIDKILEEIDPMDVMFLINALYFKGDWAKPFPVDNTRPSDFYPEVGPVESVPFMNTDDVLLYRDEADYQAVELAFKDTSFVLQLIMPKDQELVSFINSLSLAALQNLTSQTFTTGRIILMVPKFELEYKITLNEVLKKVGINQAFDPIKADFGRIGKGTLGNLYISKVEHKTYLKIDEKGAEGAAVTSVGISQTSLPPVLQFNRPFLVTLIHKPSGTPLFMGKMGKIK